MFGSKTNKSNRGRDRFESMLDNVDLFKRSVPTFNMRGRLFVPSMAGGVLSFTIFFVMIIYAALKMIQLFSRTNPNISSYEQTAYYDSSHVVNLKESGLRFAFGVEGYLD